MSQLLKKFALLTACAVLALCFATRPAHAQDVEVATGGTGDHLLFAYWSTANYTNTSVNIHSPLGVRSSGEAMNVVKVVIRDTMHEQVVAFNICLNPGDSWTATLSMDGLMVMDAGECDDNVVQPAAPGRDPADMMPTPMMGEMVSLGADSGYLEAWLNPRRTLTDDSVSCSGADYRACQDETADANSGYDTDILPDDATPKPISGSAMLVSPTSGFSSSYNAVALDGCGATPGAPIVGRTVTAPTAIDDGDGCWTIGVDGTAVAGTADGAWIRQALRGVTTALGANGEPAAADGNQAKDILTGRWTAIDDMNVMSHTKVVLTLPVNHLNYEDLTGAEDDMEDGTDPVSIIVFDDSGAIVLNNRELMLGMNVNTCMFGSMPGMMDDHDHDMDMDGGMTGADMHGDDMDMDMPMLSCNGMDMGELTAMSGEFRIFNNRFDNGSATADNFSDGTEITGLSEDNNTDARDDTERDDEGGQDPAESLAAIGLIFSYFMGTDGVQYDQATSVQSISVAADASTL